MKSNPNNKKFGGSSDAKWCEKYTKKCFRRCDEKDTSCKYGRASHYSKDCAYTHKVLYGFVNMGNILKDFPKKNETSRQYVLQKEKAKAYHMILDEETRGKEFKAACWEY